MKLLSLNLCKENVKYFFDPSVPKLRTFPLYYAALRFSNHPDSLIRTSVRTITLQIYTECTGEEATRTLLDLPFIQYFGNLALQLKQLWV